MGKITVLAATAVINTGMHDFSFLFRLPDPTLAFDDPWGGLQKIDDRWHIALYGSTGLRLAGGAKFGREEDETFLLKQATDSSDITLLMTQELLPDFERIARLAGIETVIHLYPKPLATSRNAHV